MKTAKKLIPTCTQIFQCEIETCLTCGKPLVNNSYRSGRKIVQGLEDIVQISYQPKHCINPECSDYQHSLTQVRRNRSQNTQKSLFFAIGLFLSACIYQERTFDFLM